MPTVNIVGAGRVGKMLGRLLHQHQLATIQQLCNQTLVSARAGADFIGAGEAVENLSELSPADITLITSTDDTTESICQKLLDKNKIKPDSIVLHCSGALGSNILTPAKEVGAWIASLHPLKSIADSEQAANTFAGTYCTLEGDEKALLVLRNWVQQWGAHAVSILPEQKMQYHAASVLSCAGLTTLFGTAVELYQDCGMSEQEAQAMLGPFMQETLDNNKKLGAAKALTGPVARGDEKVIVKHQGVLAKYDGRVEKLYTAMTALAKKLIS